MLGIGKLYKLRQRIKMREWSKMNSAVNAINSEFENIDVEVY